MDVESNKLAMRRVFEEGFSQGRLEVVDECLAPTAVDRHEFTETEGDFGGHLKGVIAMLRGAMPDLSMTVEDVIGEGDRVAARVTLTGTHTGAPLFGVAPRGRAARVEQFHIVQFDDEGRGLVHWASVGEAELLAQLEGSPAASVSP